MSRNLRTALIFGGFISLIGAAFYPIYFRPLMRLEEYRQGRAKPAKPKVTWESRDTSLFLPLSFRPQPQACGAESQQAYEKSLDVEMPLSLEGHFPNYTASAQNMLFIPFTVESNEVHRQSLIC
ncbi:small integral membrane protein 20 isoform X1 [Hippopotamus amphibius kiboko]|uniref:small integral membrane protein 20 isoform X1 n=1 Tax=Hippopotamus amphibius kiboko TaxID=575201 RepID=UPI0025929FDF|nr:small integral membrane protein 20 isoform X1 [Hippopotamus amphibius kiboko]